MKNWNLILFDNCLMMCSHWNVMFENDKIVSIAQTVIEFVILNSLIVFDTWKFNFPKLVVFNSNCCRQGCPIPVTYWTFCQIFCSNFDEICSLCNDKFIYTLTCYVFHKINFRLALNPRWYLKSDITAQRKCRTIYVREIMRNITPTLCL